MTTGEAWKETQARYDTATAWSRSRFPVTEGGEELIATIQREEEQAYIETRRRFASLLTYIQRQVRPLEGKKTPEPTPIRTHESVTPTRDEDDAA